MIHRLNAYGPMDFPLPTPASYLGDIGDDIQPPEFTESLPDFTQFVDSAPPPPLDYSALSAQDQVMLDTLPGWDGQTDPFNQGINLMNDGSFASLPNSPNVTSPNVPQPSLWDRIVNTLRPATAVAASSIASGAITSKPPTYPSAQLPPTTQQSALASAAHSAGQFITGSSMIAGVPNLVVIGGSLLAFKVFSGRNVEFSYSRRSPRKSKK